jgi:hypothetical protein
VHHYALAVHEELPIRLSYLVLYVDYIALDANIAEIIGH